MVDADRNRDGEGRNGDREEEPGEEGGHTDRRGYEAGMHTKTLGEGLVPTGEMTKDETDAQADRLEMGQRAG